MAHRVTAHAAVCCLQPKNYLDFVTNYKRLLSTQRKDNIETTTRLSNGLAKLTQVSAEVDVLQQELSQAKVVVEAATRECNQLLEVRQAAQQKHLHSNVECSSLVGSVSQRIPFNPALPFSLPAEGTLCGCHKPHSVVAPSTPFAAACDVQVISANTANAETKQKAAQEKEAALQVESVQIAQDKEEAEQALSEAIPALEDAAAALRDLKKDDITEIRSFAKPHVLVQRVSSNHSA
jgi:dynein heavy chain